MFTSDETAIRLAGARRLDACDAPRQGDATGGGRPRLPKEPLGDRACVVLPRAQRKPRRWYGLRGVIPGSTRGRTTARKRIRGVMQAVGIAGQRACARSLRHAYGVNTALTKVPETFIQKWLGHADLETSAIRLDMTGPEDRAIAERIWHSWAPSGTYPAIL